METGFYWAKEKYRYGFNPLGYTMIAAVYGKEPFLKVKVWLLAENAVKDNVDIEFITLGPMIELPTMEDAEDGK